MKFFLKPRFALLSIELPELTMWKFHRNSHISPYGQVGLDHNIIVFICVLFVSTE